MGDPVDLSVLESLKELGEEEFQEILALFLTDGVGYLEEIQGALSRQDPTGLEKSAHTLKGSSSVLGANEVSELCAKLQEIGRSGTLEGVPPLVESLVSEFQRVQEVLNQHRKRGSEGAE
jgi:histidine phosphotransfer protein HptB